MVKICFNKWKLIIIILILQGCVNNSFYPANMDYEFGFFTQRISGLITDNEGQQIENSFIIIRKYYSQVISVEEKIYTPEVSLLFPNEYGDFTITMESSVAKIDLLFIASGYVMQSFLFQRQIGIGNISYYAKMQSTNAWKEHFFLNIQPLLQHLILEKRYLLPEIHQSFLDEWQEKEKQQFSNYPSLD